MIKKHTIMWMTVIIMMTVINDDDRDDDSNIRYKIYGCAHKIQL